MISEEQVWSALPPQGFLHTFIRHCYEASDAHLAFALAGGLVTLATFAPYIEVQHGSPVPPHLWSMLVGDAYDSRKSTIVGISRRMVAQVDPARILVNPESSAALVEALADQEQAVFFQSEMGDFLTSTGRGSYKASLRTKMMECWDGSPISKGKVKKNAVYVNKPRLSLLGGVATQFVQSNSGADEWMNGDFSRYFIVYTGTHEFPGGRERDNPLPTDHPWGFGESVEILSRLHGLAPDVGPCVGWGGDAVKKYWVEQMAQMEDDLHARHDREGMAWARSSLGRARVTGIKAALLWSFDCGPAWWAAQHHPGRGWRLNKEAIDFGVAIAAVHAESVMTLLSRLDANHYERQRRRVLSVFEDRRLHRYADIAVRVKPKMTHRDFDQVMETMIFHGDLYRIPSRLGGEDYYWVEPPPENVLFDPETSSWV